MDALIDYLDEAAYWRKKAQLHGSGLRYWFCIVKAKEALRLACIHRNFMAPEERPTYGG